MSAVTIMIIKQGEKFRICRYGGNIAFQVKNAFDHWVVKYLFINEADLEQFFKDMGIEDKEDK